MISPKTIILATKNIFSKVTLIFLFVSICLKIRCFFPTFPVQNDDFPVQNDDFPVQNDDFPVRNDGFWVRNDDFLVQNDTFSLQFPGTKR